MAIKKISFNKEGLVSEEIVNREMVKQPEKKKVKKTKTSSAKKKSSKSTPKKKAVKVTVTGDKKDGVDLGKSLLEQNVIKFICTRCSSERVCENADVVLDCGLCGAKMELAV